MKKILLGLTLLSSIAMGEVIDCLRLPKEHSYYVMTHNTQLEDETPNEEKVRAMRETTEAIEEMEGFTREEKFGGISYIFGRDVDYINEETGFIVRLFSVDVIKNR